RPVPARRPRRRGAAQGGRRRDVPRQAGRARQLRLPGARRGRRPRPPVYDHPPAPRAGPRRARAALPARLQGRDRRAGRRRGAAALERPQRGTDPAGGLRAGGRGDGADRRARRLGARAPVPARRGVERARPAPGATLVQSFSAPAAQRRGRRAHLRARRRLPAGPGLPPRAPCALRGDDRAARGPDRRVDIGSPRVEVYGTARGPLARLADPVAARSRARRHALFLRLTGVTPATRIVDVGCGTAGLRALAPALDITGVDVVERPDYPGPFVRADATERLP